MTDNTQTPEDPKVIVSVEGSIGLLELNRPKALNSLDPDMIDLIDEALKKWKDDDSIEQVVVFSGSERAFCAGGDVRHVRESVLEGDFESGDKFFATEYIMNGDLAEFPKPYIALINGVVMGGGLGISVHGSHRVITERTFAAMPEMAIGYMPDVGVPYFLEHMEVNAATPHKSHALAVFLTTTGWHMSPADMLFAGVATHFIPSEEMGNLHKAIISDGVDKAINQYCISREKLVNSDGLVQPSASGNLPYGEHDVIRELKNSELATYLSDIEATFNFDSLAEIEEALDKHDNEEFVEKVRQHFQSANPASLVAATELHGAIARCASIREELELERVVGEELRRDPNFAEGVRAVLVDKDRNASFKPDNTADVDVNKYRDLINKSLES